MRPEGLRGRLGYLPFLREDGLFSSRRDVPYMRATRLRELHGGLPSIPSQEDRLQALRQDIPGP